MQKMFPRSDTGIAQQWPVLPIIREVRQIALARTGDSCFEVSTDCRVQVILTRWGARGWTQCRRC
jgi:hypothetical protein